MSSVAPEENVNAAETVRCWADEKLVQSCGEKGCYVSFKKPRSRPAAAVPARETMSEAARKELAQQADYVGSPHHTDIPKFGLQNNPRTGATTIERAEEQGLKNPTCTVCPRKWARRLDDVRALLQAAIEAGNFVAPLHGELP